MNMKNKAISRTFKLAKEELKDSKFICYALPEDEFGDICRNIIKERLDGHHIYESWIRNLHHDLYITMLSKGFHDGRIQWLDSLIEEFDIDGYYKR